MKKNQSVLFLYKNDKVRKPMA